MPGTAHLRGENGVRLFAVLSVFASTLVFGLGRVLDREDDVFVRHPPSAFFPIAAEAAQFETLGRCPVGSDLLVRVRQIGKRIRGQLASELTFNPFKAVWIDPIFSFVRFERLPDFDDV